MAYSTFNEDEWRSRKCNLERTLRWHWHMNTTRIEQSLVWIFRVRMGFLSWIIYKTSANSLSKRQRSFISHLISPVSTSCTHNIHVHAFNYVATIPLASKHKITAYMKKNSKNGDSHILPSMFICKVPQIN